MIRWFAAHPTAANLVLVILVAVGLFAAPTLQRETFPDYRPGEVSIEVAYRGPAPPTWRTTSAGVCTMPSKAWNTWTNSSVPPRTTAPRPPPAWPPRHHGAVPG